MGFTKMISQFKNYINESEEDDEGDQKCSNCGTTNPDREIEGGLCMNCFRGMPMDQWMTPHGSSVTPFGGQKGWAPAPEEDQKIKLEINDEGNLYVPERFIRDDSHLNEKYGLVLICKIEGEDRYGDYVKGNYSKLNMKRLACALFDEREMGSIPDVGSVILPNGKEFHIDSNLPSDDDEDFNPKPKKGWHFESLDRIERNKESLTHKCRECGQLKLSRSDIEAGNAICQNCQRAYDQKGYKIAEDWYEDTDWSRTDSKRPSGRMMHEMEIDEFEYEGRLFTCLVEYNVTFEDGEIDSLDYRIKELAEFIGNDGVPVEQSDPIFSEVEDAIEEQVYENVMREVEEGGLGMHGTYDSTPDPLTVAKGKREDALLGEATSVACKNCGCPVEEAGDQGMTCKMTGDFYCCAECHREARCCGSSSSTAWEMGAFEESLEQDDQAISEAFEGTMEEEEAAFAEGYGARMNASGSKEEIDQMLRSVIKSHRFKDSWLMGWDQANDELGAKERASQRR